MKKRDTIYVLVFMLLLVWLIYFCMNYIHVEVDEPLPKTDTTTYVDTIPYYKPISKDSTVIRYVKVKVPTSAKEDPTPCKDSMDVELSITQKEYQDSGYHAWVSGYLPQLDSIRIYNKNTIITHTVTNSVTKYKTKHWGIGIQVGYGYHFSHVSPYIGVGIQYNILNW